MWTARCTLQIAQMFTGLSPVQAALVYLDWAAHLAISPGKQMEVMWQTLKDMQCVCPDLATHTMPFQAVHHDGSTGPISCHPGDKRFQAPRGRSGRSTCTLKASSSWSAPGNVPRTMCPA